MAGTKAHSVVAIDALTAIGDTILVVDMEFGERALSSGIVLLNDDGKSHGIRPRWGCVFAKGPESSNNIDIGNYILVSHGRWTRGVDIEINKEVVTIRRVDPNDILAKSATRPDDDTLSTAISITQK
jgi:hypothetical protein